MFLTVVTVLLVLLGACLLLFAGIWVYALVLMKKRPPLALYEARTKEADYLSLSDVPARQTELLVEMEDSDFYTHRGVDPGEIRCAIHLNFGAKKIVYGGSTIRQGSHSGFLYQYHILRQRDLRSFGRSPVLLQQTGLGPDAESDVPPGLSPGNPDQGQPHSVS